MITHAHTDERAIERISKLPECIQPHIDLNDPCWSYCPQGWRALVEELHHKLIEYYPEYQIHQIKEKYGGLRFYTDVSYSKGDEGSALLLEYENRSINTCDVCGNPGTTKSVGFFIATRCEEHRESERLRAKVSEHGR